MKSSDSDYVKFVVTNGVGTMSFNRPDKLNPLDLPMIHAALQVVTNLPTDLRVLVIRGAGQKAFAAGADIDELKRRTPWADIDFGPRRLLAQYLERSRIPTVAAINGWALGGGFELALACHIRVASSNAIMGLPELRLGMIPGNGGTVRLSRLVGRGKALEMILLGGRLDAAKALELGVATRVFDKDAFDSQLAEFCQELARLPPVATSAAIDCVNMGSEMDRDQAIEYEHRWFQLCLGGAEKIEGIAAFLEKRRPMFQGAVHLKES